MSNYVFYYDLGGAVGERSTGTQECRGIRHADIEIRLMSNKDGEPLRKP